MTRMLPGLLHGDTITVVRQGETGRDDYNQPIYESTEHDITEVAVQPAGGAEEDRTTTREVVTTGLWISGPLDMDVRMTDLIRYRGELYEIVGDIRPWRTTIGLVDHTELNLTRWQG